MTNITLVFAKPVKWADQFNHSFKAYCRLSEPVDMSDMTENEQEEFVNAVCDTLQLGVCPFCYPGGYYAHMPSLHIVGTRMIVYQNRGYDV